MRKDKDDDNSNDTLSPLAMASLQMHEMFVELRKAGFNRQEALYIVVKMAVGGGDE